MIWHIWCPVAAPFGARYAWMYAAARQEPCRQGRKSPAGQQEAPQTGPQEAPQDSKRPHRTARGSADDAAEPPCSRCIDCGIRNPVDRARYRMSYTDRTVSACGSPSRIRICLLPFSRSK